MTLSLAPMQGYSDLIYRTTISKIGGIDVFYAPYIKVEGGEIKPKSLADIAPEINNGLTVVPQVLANKTDDMLQVARAVGKLGYTKLNWNLGCPFPMVAKRQLGAGLLPYPEKIDSLLSDFEAQSDIALSVKMRLGYLSPDEIWPVLDVLNRHNIKEIIVHPRIGKQMYNGEADKRIMPEIISKSAHPVAYNGDILTAGQARELIDANPTVTHLMIGRGLLRNPFLANEIKGETLNISQKRSRFSDFTVEIAGRQLNRLQGAGHFLQKMTTYWEYWSQMFADQHKVLKMVKKCHSVDEYFSVTEMVTNNYPLSDMA